LSGRSLAKTDPNFYLYFQPFDSLFFYNINAAVWADDIARAATVAFFKLDFNAVEAFFIAFAAFANRANRADCDTQITAFTLFKIYLSFLCHISAIYYHN